MTAIACPTTVHPLTGEPFARIVPFTPVGTLTNTGTTLLATVLDTHGPAFVANIPLCAYGERIPHTGAALAQKLAQVFLCHGWRIVGTYETDPHHPDAVRAWMLHDIEPADLARQIAPCMRCGTGPCHLTCPTPSQLREPQTHRGPRWL